MNASGSSTVNFGSELVENFIVSTKKYLTLLSEVAAELGRSVPNTEERLTLLKSGYLIMVHIPALRDADLENDLSRYSEI